ncbi:amino acid ABC transporter substrate-binding protein [Vulcanimicrobium alpinum]|uniref:Amino acid ABC transporter substrate-binding protein n=1 Tax=Vulcanimicrobium alpinum TaxID=3016050 RepID=A0AAN1XZS2_UNVUL|nr:ABC transporter substrate-binding protein [Vulcanimicrobium alpinum]BDE07821.1 amino acid ABC transporter substrate-binding protein [Vulcanimicrobium alpinum]
MSARRVCLAFAAAIAVASMPFASRAADPQEIVIGSILPLTGPSAQTGAGLRTAQTLAADLVNGHVSYPLPMVGKSGLPHLGHARIKLVFADSQGKPDQARAAAEQLITQEHAVALIGTYASSTTATASQVAERYGIPFLNPDSSAPSLTARGLKWFFRTTPNDATFAENFYQFFADLNRTKKIAVKKVAVVGEDGLFGTGAGDAEEEIGKRRGFTIVTRVAYPATTTEVNAEVQKVKAAAPDVVMMASYAPDALLFMRGFKDQGILLQGILAQDAGFIDPGFVKTEGKDAEGVFTREVFSLDIKHRNKAVPLIDQLFRLRFGDKPLDGNTARDIMGVLVLADAIDRAGSTKPDAIRTALQNTNIPGILTLMPWKQIKFDAQGQNVGGVGIIEQIQDGKYETVWPFDVAVKAPIWPMPAWKR